MWQYTTETIINSKEGNLDGRVRFELFDLNGVKQAAALKAGEVGYFIIDGVNSFKTDKISAIYHTPYCAADPAEATLTVPAVAEGDVLRLVIKLREDGRTSSYMQNAYLRPTKPLRYEITATGTDTTDAEKLVDLIKKDLALTDFKLIKASATGAVITLTGADEYIRFAEAPELVKVTVPTAGGGAYLGFEDYTVLAEGKITKVGHLGAGTVDHLIKDLRIPTAANTNFFGPDNGGRPIPGGEYDQYTIEYETERHHIAGGVMGSVGEKSRTTHVLFIEKNVLPDFKAVLANIGVTPIEAGNPAVDASASNKNFTGTEFTKKADPEVGSVQ